MAAQARPADTARTPAYERLAEIIAADRCVVLDGGTATELGGAGVGPGADEGRWGTRALVHSPDAVLDVHRRYVRTGCDVVSTNT